LRKERSVVKCYYSNSHSCCSFHLSPPPPRFPPQLDILVSRCAQEIVGVTNVHLDYPKKVLHVTYDSHLDPKIIYQIAICIENAGYSVEWGKGLHINYFKIVGMYCNHCVGTVERAIQPIGGVKTVIVNLDKHIATVIVDPSFKSEELIEAISSVGYDATPYEGSRDIYLRIEGMVCIFT
jgi:copper chaperone